MSAIVLSSPAMFKGVRLDACLACMRIPSIRRSRPATIDLDVLSLYAQATAEVLSQKIPMCLWVRSMFFWHSSTSQFRIAPANSRSFIVRVPFMLLNVISCDLMSSGHSSCQRMGDRCDRPLVQTPPVPMPQESLYPR